MTTTSTTVATSRRSRRAQRGAVSAEYALVTAAVVGFGGILIQILRDPQIQQALMKLLMRLIEIVSQAF
ncbi:MAG: DUF4244 domain-containing protein [Actinomycetia bacterium]|nr:DUF4244 domain-containing protein [Actinomycetes bacterium]